MKSTKWYIENKIWPTQDHKEVKIANMSDTHLKNAYLRCVTQNWRLRIVDTLLEEMEKRGFKETHPEYFV